ncbi:hypothetical protein [Paraglaciecola sp.]|uniref:hypothetical protein n=1 Tax=Paraglaciecola sp. TaxID=1920173 RepID=UPI003EF5CE33
MSQSDDMKIAKKVNDLLDTENEKLSVEACADISRARLQALNSANPDKLTLARFISKPTQFVVAPLALSAVFLVLVNFYSGDTLPHLPKHLFAQDVPMEDLAMLEELEFASWLAEQKEMVY